MGETSAVYKHDAHTFSPFQGYGVVFFCYFLKYTFDLLAICLKSNDIK